MTSADNVLVRVHTDAGLVGQAEAQPRPYTYGETQTSIVDAVSGPLNDALAGVDPLRSELVAARCASVTGNYVARGAVDLAVWDLIGADPRACRATRCWAASPTTSPRRTWSRSATPAEMAEDASRSTSASGSPPSRSRSDASRRWTSRPSARSARRCPDADLYVDANRGWSYDDAVRAGDALVELGVRAIEEPISVDDRAGRLRLAERWDVPLGGDESCISLAHVDRALDEGAVRRREHQDGAHRVHRVAPDPRSVPGPQRPRGRRQPVRGRDRRAATVTFAAAFAATAGQPAEITNFLDLADDLVVAGPEIRDGRAAVPRGAGLGFEVDEDRLQRYRLDR